MINKSNVPKSDDNFHSLPVPQGCEFSTFPMPKGTHLRDVVNELSSLSPRQPLGPLASRLSTKIKQWYLRARKMVRGNSVTVTGSLQKSYSLWKEHLSFLPCAHRDRILSRIFDGVHREGRELATLRHRESVLSHCLR